MRFMNAALSIAHYLCAAVRVGRSESSPHTISLPSTRVGVSKANPLIPSDKRPEPARTVDRGTITGHEMAALACHNLGAPRALTSQLRSHWHGRTLGNLDPRRTSISAAAYPSYQRWGRTSRL